MIDTALIADCKQFAEDIAPKEFTLRPLYVVDSHRFGTRFLPSDCLGTAIPAAAVLSDFRQRLGSEWCGHGHLIVLFGDTIEAAYRPEYFRAGLLQTFVHELAHIAHLPVGQRVADPSPITVDADTRRVERAYLARCIETTEPAQTSDDCPHGWRFLRRVCHLWYRAVIAGWSIEPHGVLGSAFGFGPQLPHWVCALIPELTAMTQAKFAAIEASEPPPGFMSMWGRYLTFHESSKTRIEE